MRESSSEPLESAHPWSDSATLNRGSDRSALLRTLSGRAGSANTLFEEEEEESGGALRTKKKPSLEVPAPAPCNSMYFILMLFTAMSHSALSFRLPLSGERADTR